MSVCVCVCVCTLCRGNNGARHLVTGKVKQVAGQTEHIGRETNDIFVQCLISSGYCTLFTFAGIVTDFSRTPEGTVNGRKGNWNNGGNISFGLRADFFGVILHTVIKMTAAHNLERMERLSIFIVYTHYCISAPTSLVQ